MTTCSDTLMLLQYVTSATVIFSVDGRLQIDMVGAYAGRDYQLELLRLADPLGR